VPLPSFYIQGVGVTRKIPKPVTIIILVGLYLWELSYHHLIVIWAYANPPWARQVVSIMYLGYVFSTAAPECFSTK
jgi:hypothetical protein